MKTLIAISFILISNISFSQSQTEMNLSAEDKFIINDRKLNEIYNQILTEYSDNKQFIKNLKASERLWVKFRDAEMLMRYPEGDSIRNGSVFNLCYFHYITELTESRIQTLQEWTDGVQEGEVCGGSIKMN
jgi:uncharacterized protein YecT (DUF1311 family)